MSDPRAGAGGELARVGSASPAPPLPDPQVASPTPTPADATTTPASTQVKVVDRSSPVRAVVFAILAVAAGVAGVLALRRGISSDDFPPFLADQQYTTITKYSGPWLTAAAGAALLAGLLLLAAVVELTRWLRRPHRGDSARRDDSARTATAGPLT